MDMDNIFAVAKQVILQAGEETMKYYGKEYDVTKKDDDSPLTEADLASSRVIMGVLKKSFPNCGFLNEEEKDDKSRLRREYVWIVDPIDGSKEFIKETGEFTVNIGLVSNGEPVIGLVYLPAKEILYYATKGEGAFREVEGEKKKITVSERDKFEDMILTRSRSHASDKEKEMEEVFARTIPSGSSVKGCLVAEGNADVYVRKNPVNEWDVCAMDCIIREAGGKMTDFEGKERTYNSEDPLLTGFAATNGKKHKEILEMFR